MTTNIHTFEKSKLGKAPFRFVGFYSLPSPSLAEHNPSAYMNQLNNAPKEYKVGSCGYCGAGLIHNYLIKSSDGNTFSVGCECVNKTGDNGLIKEVKQAKRTEEQRKRAEKRKLENEKRQEEFAKKAEKNKLENEEKYPDVIEYLKNKENAVGFVYEMQFNYRKFVLTEGQVEAIRRIIKSEKEQKTFTIGNYEIGNKLKNLFVKIRKINGFETQYGYTFIYEFINEENVRFKWFTQNDAGKVDDEIILSSGTVKNIENSEKWGKSVILTRCRIKK